MVGIGDSRGHDIAKKFGIVDLRSTGVGPRHQYSRAGIPGAVEKPSSSHFVEARVLVQDDGKHSTGQKVSNAVVCKRQSIAFA